MGRMTAVFRSLGSKQILILLGVVTTTILLIQSVGIATFSTIPFLSSSSSLAFTLSRSATGTRRGACCTGLTLGSVTMVVSPIWPKPHVVELVAAVVKDFVQCLTSFHFNHVLGDEIRGTYSLSMN